ncbi:hypothetical protein [Methylobacterium goesingense]|uniref:Helix-turn-helix domain-containing protein n=1 Tax=Methylobacterium goesingense TaxID=243690 RepID=A0ABV2L6U8_9HYPH|nr:hypothetical protein [Methylobacterium goesingense]
MSEHVTARRADATGRSTGKFLDSKFRKSNSVPKGQAFVWFTREMLESPAWRAMSQNARLAVDRVCVEHMSHGGGQNGALPVTYDDFEHAGIRRGSIRRAIAEALALGFIEMTRKGTRGWGEFTGEPSHFRLAWLPTSENGAVTIRWKRFETLAEAERVAAAAREEASSRRNLSEIKDQRDPVIRRVRKFKSQ